LGELSLKEIQDKLKSKNSITDNLTEDEWTLFNDTKFTHPFSEGDTTYSPSQCLVHFAYSQFRPISRPNKTLTNISPQPSCRKKARSIV
jgi:hypothetical protein